MYIEFDEETHSYHADGKRVPSVSEIISPLNDFSSIPQEVLENAANRGKALHKAMEKFVDGVEMPDIRNFLDLNTPIGQDNYNRWFNEVDEKLIGCGYIQEQYMVGDWEGLLFGFTTDIYSNTCEVLDWKTCAALKPSHAVQLEAYKIGLESNGESPIYLAIGHLRKDKPFRMVDKDTPRQKVFNTFNISDKEMFIYLLTNWYKDRGLR